MLLARGRATVGDASLQWALAFAPRFWLSIGEHRGLVVDTSVIPPSRLPAKDHVCLNLLVAGTWRVQDGPSFEAPCALVLSQAHLEGADGRRTLNYRVEGAPLSMIELHVDLAHTALRVRDLPFPIELDARTWDAARLVVERSHENDHETEVAILALLTCLGVRSLVSRDVAALRMIDAPLRLMWRGLRPVVERFDLLSGLKEVCATMGVTPREFDRYARLFLSSFGIMGEGWREVSRHLRLKLAIIFLSASGATINEVARAVGYGSAEAMIRAFRDEGLPPPGVLRTRITTG
jgi:AraC-like DNA-binding protein